MTSRKPPSRHLYRAYIASIIVTATAALYCLMALGIIYANINADDIHTVEDFQLLFVGFLFFNFPGITTLILANDYLNRIADNREFRSRTFEIIGIIACPHTLIVSACLFGFSGIFF